jgi:hypothetical protein
MAKTEGGVYTGNERATLLDPVGKRRLIMEDTRLCEEGPPGSPFPQTVLPSSTGFAGRRVRIDCVTFEGMEPAFRDLGLRDALKIGKVPRSLRSPAKSVIFVEDGFSAFVAVDAPPLSWWKRRLARFLGVRLPTQIWYWYQVID